MNAIRKKIVAGNWKMNNNLEEGKALVSEVINMADSEVPGDVLLILCPPATHLSVVVQMVGSKEHVAVAAQNISEHKSGAYTGEISGAMIKSVGAKYVILGHSERREYFKETDMLLANKVNAALENGLLPIFCCGEPLAVRESESHYKYVTEQLTSSLFHLTADQMRNIVIAYEPIWAIGTGKTATATQAQEMHRKIRQHIAEKYGDDVAKQISILYGGSAKPANAPEIFAGEDVDGGLIGGASLVARDFIDIAKAF